MLYSSHKSNITLPWVMCASHINSKCSPLDKLCAHLPGRPCIYNYHGVFWLVHQLNELDAISNILKKNIDVIYGLLEIGHVHYNWFKFIVHVYTLLLLFVTILLFVLFITCCQLGVTNASILLYTYIGSQNCIVSVNNWEHHHFCFRFVHILWYIFEL